MVDTVTPAAACEGDDDLMIAVLDAVPDASAVLDRTGTIVAVNHAWRMFTLDNGGDPASTGVGVNYMQVCVNALQAGCIDAAEVVAGLRAVLDGETVECDLEYPCPSPAVGRWFVLRVTPLRGPRPGALVSHVNISRRKLAEQDLERRASRDPLTGLANRTQLTRRLASALTQRIGREPRADVGVLFIDLDGFKAVNDNYGHAAGDELLQNVAGRISALLRPQDTCARIGGDEFVVVAPRITHEGLVTLADRVGSAIAVPQMIHGRSVVVRGSVGYDLATPGAEPRHVLARADEAMYEAKRRRRSHPS